MPAFPAPDWITSDEPVAYSDALAFMEARAGRIADGEAAEAVWLLEHPPLYTAGTSAKASDLLDAGGFPVYATGRGGQYTYHGPGQRVGYTMLDVKARGGDIRRFVRDLEQWLILTLAEFGVIGERREGRVGIWVVDPVTGAEDKIAALGIRIRRGVSFHGVSLNVDPDLSLFAGIVPCGISQHGVTSLKRLGKAVSMPDIDAALRRSFAAVFGG